MKVNELIQELETLKKNGWGESSVCVYEAFGSIYQPIERIQGYCGTVLIVKEK